MFGAWQRWRWSTAALALMTQALGCGAGAPASPAAAKPCDSCPPCAPARDPAATPGKPRGPVTASGAELPPGNWKEMVTDTLIIHHLEERAAEAERFKGYFGELHGALAKAFAGHDVTAVMKDPVVCHAYLVPSPTPAASPGRATARTSYGDGAYCELHFLPSSALTEDQRCCTVIGERRDERSDQRSVAHEYGGVFIARLNRQHAGWRFFTAPSWFVQGYEEYLAVSLSNAHNQMVTFEKYKDLVRKDATRVGFFGVANEYTDGAVLLSFLHDEFGAAKVHGVLLSKEKTFWAAVTKELGVPQDQLYGRFAKWRKKTLGAK
jgi:hypothetical protein